MSLNRADADTWLVLIATEDEVVENAVLHCFRLFLSEDFDNVDARVHAITLPVKRIRRQLRLLENLRNRLLEALFVEIERVLQRRNTSAALTKLFLRFDVCLRGRHFFAICLGDFRFQFIITKWRVFSQIIVR